MSFLIYDCEIIKAIPSDREPRVDSVEYCEGWRDFSNMGISVASFATADTEFYWDSRANPVKQLQGIFKGVYPVVSFNGKGFDDRLMQAHGIQVQTHYDLLEEVRIAAYGSPDFRDAPKGYSYALGKIAAANGLAKTGSGENAAIQWQQGKYQEVIRYCMNDSRITREILLMGLRGTLLDPNTAKGLRLRPLPTNQP